jgi:hypothetical protein
MRTGVKTEGVNTEHGGRNEDDMAKLKDAVCNGRKTTSLTSNIATQELDTFSNLNDWDSKISLYSLP